MAERFQAMYLEHTAPWDIGRAQAEFVRLSDTGWIGGVVIDVGCGTGENALYFAHAGHEVVGVDFAPEAIDRARRKAADRKIAAQFEIADALDLSAYANSFDTATDCGVFHVFDDHDRAAYVRSVRGVLRPGGHMFVMCFSERVPGDWGPRRVTQRELRDAFSDGWRVDDISEARFDVASDDVTTVDAWLTSVTRP